MSAILWVRMENRQLIGQIRNISLTQLMPDDLPEVPMSTCSGAVRAPRTLTMSMTMTSPMRVTFFGFFCMLFSIFLQRRGVVHQQLKNEDLSQYADGFHSVCLAKCGSRIFTLGF